jgi:DNA-binding NtrC family response regulator
MVDPYMPTALPVVAEVPKTPVFTGDISDLSSKPLIDPDAIGEVTMEELERELIEQTLAKFNHNRRRTAQTLGIAERTLYRKIQAYGLDKK